MFKKLNVFDYFKKTNNGKASCQFCNSTLVCSTNGNSNLKMHLFMLHPEQLGLTKILSTKKPQMINRSLIWTYYSKTEDGDRLASCNLCGKVLSYRSTTTNLKVHLSRSHSKEFVRYVENLPLHSDSTETVFVDTNNADDSDESDHTSLDIWNYFEQETGGRVRCVVCRASKPNNVEDLKRHMEENHPKLLQVSGNSQDNMGSDQESVKEDDGAYTEVVYLEEDTKKSPTKPKYLYKTEESLKSVQRMSDLQQRLDKKRRGSSSSEESPLRKANKSNELDTFMTYINCLLKQLPKDTCAKLQMEIINLIMNVKLNKCNESASDMSLKVPVISNYVTVAENSSNKMQVETDTNSAETSDHSYMYLEPNTRRQSHMTHDS